MSRYQQAPYSDSPSPAPQGNYGGSYGNGGGGYGNGGGGYSDEPGYGSGPAYGSAAGAGGSYPMSSTNPYAASGSPRGYAQPKKTRNKWLWIGLPILIIIIIIAAVLGGVLGSRKSSSASTSSNGSSAGASNGNTGLPAGISNTGVNSAAATNTGANGEVYLAIATDGYMLPMYATGTFTSGYSTPTVLSSPSKLDSWPADPSPPSNSTAGIRNHPRLIAPAYKWAALSSGGLIANDPYLKYWNQTIINNATSTLNDEPTPYVEDGGLSGSGVLDVARAIKLKVKNWSYAYRMTNNTVFADRVWLELTTAAGNNSAVPFGATDGTAWNAAHFLDLGEFCSAFAIGYDWVYDHWTDAQRDALMWSMLNLGLSFGYNALTNNAAAQAGGYAWWTGMNGAAQVNGNWNCVCNAGLSLASLAILDRDPTGLAAEVLALTVPSAWNNCFQGAHADGTWAETANYWYFGTTGAAELTSSLITAFGDDHGLSQSNPGWKLTSLYHMYVQGMTSLFNYGDHGPNKYSTTANSLLLWGSIFDEPRYSLYQRDHYDASEPFSMFWYDPAVSGTWWDGLALDGYFPNSTDEWATARSSWSDNSGTYWALKSGNLQGHQTHGDLDMGDFVLDAMGQRWAGELGSGQYLATAYFSSEAQNSARWLYYRKMTQGQNTLLIDYQNQNVNATPTSNFGSSGTAQGAAPSFNVSSTDTAFFTTDMSTAYNYTVKRGIRMLNGRRQVLLQDDISGVPAGTDTMWRMHTNATVTVASNGTTATLALGGQTLIASILSGPTGAVFTTMNATRLPQSPPVPDVTSEDGDQPNPGVTVLVIDSTVGGSFSLQVLFNPQWSGFSASSYVTPTSVAIDDWSLTSHN